MLHGQTLSYFSWDSNPVTQADIGPNATIKTGSPATSIAATYNGTNGLSANEVGTSGGSVGIDLDIDASSGLFDVNGIDISIAFQREESRGDFVTRGNDFVMGMNGGNYYVEFSLKDGAGGSTLIQSGNIYSIPNDNTFRLYRFTYNQNTGVAEASVDGTVVWTHIAAVGDELYWSAPTIRVGNLMDGGGNNVALFDEFEIVEIPNAPGYPGSLPVEWLNFSCSESFNGIDLNWATATETNNSHFLVEHSLDGTNYETISSEILGAGNSAYENYYTYTDKNPLGKINYYRIQQIDFDGQSEYSETIACVYEKVNELSIYPNPAKDQISITPGADTPVVIFNATGKQVLSISPVQKGIETTLNISHLPSGVYYVKTIQATQKLVIK